MSHIARQRRFRASRAAAAPLMLVMAAIAPALADAGVVERTTYLRDGPSVRYRPVDEVVGGTAVEVRGCASGWCQIGFGDATGYVTEGVVRRGPGPPGIGAAPTCFLNGQTGYHGTRNVEFCHLTTAP